MSRPLTDAELEQIRLALTADFNWGDHVQALAYCGSAKNEVIPGLLATIAADRERIEQLEAVVEVVRSVAASQRFTSVSVERLRLVLAVLDARAWLADPRGSGTP